MKLFAPIIILTLALLNSSCALFQKKEITERDINIQAAQAYNEVKAKSKLSQNKRLNEMVRRVAQRIAEASGENFEWEVILIEGPEVNAWCMPGGKMAVYTGILPVLKTEGALAAVMGHEVAHATLRHGKKGYARAIEEQKTSILIAGATIIGGEILCQTKECKQWTQLGGAAASLALTFFNRKFSREDETEADKAGQVYMAKAGYDPAESLKLWERMAQAKGGKSIPEFMSTHPADDRRRDQLAQWISEARAVYQNAPRKFGIGEEI